jgi:hypothetical protein
MIPPRARRGGLLAAAVAALGLCALGGCSPDWTAMGHGHTLRPLAVHPVERLRAPPAPLDAPESYFWDDRRRFQTDLEHHIADLHRQARVLRNGLATAAGPAPQETLRAIRNAEDRLIIELVRLNVATLSSWPGVRLGVLDAVVGLGRAIERARRAASPGTASAITI